MSAGVLQRVMCITKTHFKKAQVLLHALIGYQLNVLLDFKLFCVLLWSWYGSGIRLLMSTAPTHLLTTVCFCEAALVTSTMNSTSHINAHLTAKSSNDLALNGPKIGPDLVSLILLSGWLVCVECSVSAPACLIIVTAMRGFRQRHTKHASRLLAG